MLGTTLRQRYEIIRELGKGGFGETYIAKDRDLPGNPHCVIKRLKPQRRDAFFLQTAIRLFDREAQVLYRLGNHDQIPRLLAHFQENGEFYLAQEFIDGPDVSQELTSGRQWQEAQVIDFLQDVLKILEFVHQQNVIHRDIKPANLIRRASDNKIVLIDFGAVKEITSSGTHVHGKTVIGTRGYMPIEQKDGNPKFNSDIYALGIICIQTLTGLSPHELQKEPEVIWNKQAISPQLAAILEKMVRSDFPMRYQSATEVLQALSSLNEPTQQGSRIKTIPLALGLAVIILSVTVLAVPTVRQIIGISPPPPTTIDFSIYQNPTYGIKMKYPKNWIKRDIGDIMTRDLAEFLSPLKSNSKIFQAQVLVEVQNLNKPTSLPEYTNSRVTEITQFLTNARIHDSHSTTLAKQPAHQVVYSGKEEQYGVNVKRMAVWLLKNNRAYMITYTADESQYDDFLQTVQEMINSLEIR